LSIGLKSDFVSRLKSDFKLKFKTRFNQKDPLSSRSCHVAWHRKYPTNPSHFPTAFM